MVAKLSNRDGETIAIHRTFLKPDGSGKAEVTNPKLMLGRARGGAIYLGPIAEEVNVTEGIETGLSLQALNGKTTLAAASAGNLRGLELPVMPAASQVTIGADNDDAGIQAAKAAAVRWRKEGRDVRITAPRGLKDYNDLLLTQERLRRTR